MLFGAPPFDAISNEQIFAAILSAPLELPDYPEISSDAGNLIKSLLNKSPQSRLQSANVVKTAPWFRGIDFQKLLRKEVTPPFQPHAQSGEEVHVDPELQNESATLAAAFDEVEEGAENLDDNVFGAYSFDANFDTSTL